MNLKFSIWLASKTRWVHLTKFITMDTVPRVGEFMKFKNDAVGDYFGFRVTQITHREATGTTEVWTELLDDVDERGYSFDEEDEFDEYLTSYLAEGWQAPKGVGPNRRIRGGEMPDTRGNG